MGEKDTNDKMAKEITSLEDIEGVKLLDNVEVTYFYPVYLDIERLPYKKEGIFGGTFNINNEKYLVVCDLKPAKSSVGQCFLDSTFYKIQDEAIIDTMHDISGCCYKGHSNLEAAIKKHIERFNDSELNNLKKANKQ
jgi:hypothetical protein